MDVHNFPYPMRLLSKARRVLFQWRWILLASVSIGFLGVLAWLIVQARQNEFEQRREQQIVDTLWVDQTIRFQMGRHRDTLNRIIETLGPRLGAVSAQTIQSRVAPLLSGAKEVKAAWVYRAGQERWGVYESSGAPPMTWSKVGRESQDAYQAALAFGEARFSVPHDGRIQSDARPMPVVDMVVPVSGHSEFNAMGFTLGLQEMLNELVPWWLAKDSEIGLMYTSDAPALVTRAVEGKGRGVYVEQIELDLPGSNLWLRSNLIQGAPSVVPGLMAGGIALLSLTLLFSLTALWVDVRKRTRAEAEVRAQNAFRKAMEDSLVTGLRARDMQGRITYVNPAFCALLGYAPSELLGQMPPMPYWAPEEVQAYEKRYKAVLSGTVGPEAYETVFRHKSGRRVPVLIYEAPLIDDQGTQTGWMSSVVDISERRQHEEMQRQQQEKLMQSARLVSMGELATTLAHELNQPLAAITSYSTASLNMLKSGAGVDTIETVLQKMIDQAQRAGHVIKGVHDMMHKRPPEKKATQIPDILAQADALIRLQTRPDHVQYSLQVAPDLPAVWVDAVLIEQVIVNLTRNAVEAMRQMPSECRHLQIQIDRLDAHYARVCVVDSGCGISADLKAELFNPFFSTKPQGMGMGLRICRTLIEAHGGQLWHEDAPGGGSAFHFTLPWHTP